MSDYISRAELFNKLSTIQTPMEANEYKAKVYAVIQEMDTEDVITKKHIEKFLVTLWAKQYMPECIVNETVEKIMEKYF